MRKLIAHRYIAAGGELEEGNWFYSPMKWHALITTISSKSSLFISTNRIDQVELLELDLTSPFLSIPSRRRPWRAPPSPRRADETRGHRRRPPRPGWTAPSGPVEWLNNRAIGCESSISERRAFGTWRKYMREYMYNVSYRGQTHLPERTPDNMMRDNRRERLAWNHIVCDTSTSMLSTRISRNARCHTVYQYSTLIESSVASPSCVCTMPFRKNQISSEWCRFCESFARWLMWANLINCGSLRIYIERLLSITCKQQVSIPRNMPCRASLFAQRMHIERNIYIAWRVWERVDLSW